jgi:hypothetical protein
VPWLPLLNSDFMVSGTGLLLKSGEVVERPPQWQALLMLVGGLLSDPPEDLLAFQPHSKEEYLRQAEELFI